MTPTMKTTVRQRTLLPAEHQSGRGGAHDGQTGTKRRGRTMTTSSSDSQPNFCRSRSWCPRRVRAPAGIETWPSAAPARGFEQSVSAGGTLSLIIS